MKQRRYAFNKLPLSSNSAMRFICTQPYMQGINLHIVLCYVLLQSLVWAFKATWKQVPHGRGAPTTVILSWFNESLLRAGLPIWRQKGRRWTYVQYKLGLEKSLGWVPPSHAQRRQMSSPLTPYKTVSPLRNDFSPIYGQMHV